MSREERSNEQSFQPESSLPSQSKGKVFLQDSCSSQSILCSSAMHFQANRDSNSDSNSEHRRKRSHADMNRRSPGIQIQSKMIHSFVVLVVILSSQLVGAFLPHPNFGKTSSWKTPSSSYSPSPFAIQLQTHTPQSSLKASTDSLTEKRPQVSAGSKKSMTLQKNPFSFSTIPFPKATTDSVLTNSANAATPRNHKLAYLVNRNMTTTEMVSMTAVGTAFSVGIIYTLALRGDAEVLAGGAQLLTFADWAGVADNVLDAALPKSASNMVSVALGEGLAGVIGSIVLFTLVSLLNWRRRIVKGASSLKAEAVAGGDYFLAKAAALPLLEAVGVPPFVATIASVLFATIPYEIVKFGARQREKISDENEALQKLLEESLGKNKRKKSRKFPIMSPIRLPLVSPVSSNPSLPGSSTSKESLRLSVDLESLKPVEDGKTSNVDLVDFFSDITKWLEYDILKNDFSGRLMVDGLPLFPGIEGALFGAVSSLSAQLYADILYVYFGFGPQEIQAKVKARTADEWSAIYLSRIIVGATLFGVYEAVQIPLTSFISALLSGGVNGCIESQDYNMCIETYLAGNPPEEASPEAQLRALLITIVSTLYRFFPGLVDL
jgi:hypothetical protein